MKILFVEDDEYKRNSVITYIHNVCADAFIDIGLSVESGVRQAIYNSYDLIILDMTIPNFDSHNGRCSGNSYKNGGEIIIRELLDEGVNFKCLILTQYETFNNESIETISERVKAKCGDNYLGYIKYNKLDEEWKENLKVKIDYVKSIANR